MEFKQFLLALHLLPGLGKAKEAKIIAALRQEKNYQDRPYPWPLLTLTLVLGVKSGSSFYQALKANYGLAQDQALAYQGQWLTYFDDSYPAYLRETFQPPLILFYSGHLSALLLPAVAVVGSRQATDYGLLALRQLLPAVIHAGIAIVSGLAQGIDGLAHQITLDYGGVPIGIVGTGLDYAYPNHHRALQKHVSQQGLLLSEYPAGMPPYPSHFPNRNRIIAGLVSAVLVVEARQHSGSLITANLALQENRQVLAVPGSIHAPVCEGTNQLIQAGALPVLTSSDIIKAVQRLH